MLARDALEVLEKYVLVDGFHIVVDPIHSSGSWICNARTKKRTYFLDLYSQFASQALGWNHPAFKLLEIKAGPILNTKLANSDMYSVQYAEFVETFASVTPDFKHYFFIDGGALAVENALKCAFDWKGRKLGFDHNSSGSLLEVIHLKNAFHGRSGYTMSLTNTGPLKTGLFPRFEWPRIDNIDELKGLNRAEDDLINGCVAAIIVEPIQGEGGDIHLSTSYLKGLRELADKYEALLIFDEVQTGLGLTGKWWAYEHHDVKPDILCFGKKTQVCGIAVNERIDEVDNNVFNLSGRINSTWGGNIVDMVRASIIIEAIRDNNYVENAATMGNYFIQKLKTVEEIQNVRGRGLMIAFDLETSDRRDEVFGNLQKRKLLALKCGEKGIRFRPHLTISSKDIDTAITYLKNALCD